MPNYVDYTEIQLKDFTVSKMTNLIIVYINTA